MEIRIEGLEDFIKTLDYSSENFKKEGQKTVLKIGNKLIKLSKLKTRVDTGLLRRSWQGKSGNLEFTVFNPVKYAIYEEFGRRVVGGKGGVKGKRRKGNKIKPKKRTTSGKGYVEGVYMLTRSVKEIEQDLEKELSTMIDNLWK